jgi:putative ABC transport system permease protein
MLDLDQWQEIMATIRKNKLRTFLTGFSVAWGIFILVILLGSGNGLSKGVMHNFSDAANGIWLWGGSTSKSYNGLNVGREIELTNEDLDILDKSFGGLDNLSGRYGIWGSLISYKNNYGDFDVQAIHPGHQVTEKIDLTEGRLLNKLDINQCRKVTVIGRIVKEQIFKDEDPIGKYILVRGIPFLVVGVFNDTHDGETKRLYIPITLAQKTFITKNKVGTITFTAGNASVEEATRKIDQIKSMLAYTHKFAKDDDRALGTWNAVKEYQQMQSLFKGISIFVLVIGIFTIIAGIVGVGNIMLIVVKERTKEIGVRKAIGAKPSSIIKMIMLESLFITSIAGYIGLFLGVVILEIMSKLMPAGDFFRNPGVDFNVAIGAVLMIIFAGMLAGFIPARRAANIKPVEALRDE